MTNNQRTRCIKLKTRPTGIGSVFLKSINIPSETVAMLWPTAIIFRLIETQPIRQSVQGAVKINTLRNTGLLSAQARLQLAYNSLKSVPYSTGAQAGCSSP